MSSVSNSNIPVKKEGGHPGKSIWLLWRTLFEIDNHYTPIKPIGKGAYGVVCSAKNALSGEKVAIKKITNAFENVTDSRRTLREITLLRYLKHENIIAVRDILRPPSRDLFHDVYLVYELMDTDLHQIIRSPQDLTDDHCQYFIYQVLRGLKYVHSANVLHRDLKPSNLLLNASCDLKICDFGLARTSSDRGFMTEYVVTRWYRAPELLLSCEEYSGAIDVWSVGCIFAELLGRKPLFPGKDYIHQLTIILQQLGTPAEQDLGFIQSHKARAYIRSLPHQEAVPWDTMYPKANRLALDLLDKMLRFCPDKRIGVEEALRHPYLASLHDDECEPVAPAPFAFDFEDEDLRESALRNRVYEEMEMYHPSQGGAPAAAGGGYGATAMES
ncbi:mitogen-activated protein kinase [Pseudoscourfieldia marina]